MEIPQDIGQSKPTKTWFIKRIGDGKIFATDELDAWNLLTDKSKWRRHDFEIVGVSNGQTYFKIIRNGGVEMSELLEEKNKLVSDIQKYTQVEDRMRFTELRDDTDEAMIKVNKILTDLKGKLKEVDSKIQNFNQDLHNRAFEAELEIARNHIEFPSNQDIIAPVEKDKSKIKELLRR